MDVNVLLYASNSASPFSRRAVEFLGECAESPEVFCVAWITVMSYLRLSTSPAVSEKPLSPGEAERNIEELLRLPQARVLSEEEGFWRVYRKVTGGLSIRGNLAPDAHLAAILSQHGIGTLYTNDRDFRRFDSLRVVNPFEEKPS